jgi:hypothetical protein
MRQRYYIGYKDTLQELFTSTYKPTEQSHGHLYAAVVGPFRTKRGAQYMLNNPYVETVAHAERAASHTQRSTQRGR